MILKVVYIVLIIKFLVQFIKNIRSDKDKRGAVISVLVFIIEVYFMINVYGYIFN